ncbi:universal stress protein [Fibrella sp. ES10-3-2-2]|nr:hypothetical protein A6C57_19590 [Fibrella sp. ES10-3-2-2]
MKTLAVATDFTDGSHWATDYALELARQLHTRLILVHIYDPLPAITPAQEWLTSTAESQYFRAIHQLQQLSNELTKRSDGTVTITVVARPGSPATELAAEAAAQHADLLVMSLAGANPLEDRLDGSLATDMIPRTKLPMLLIPPGALFRSPRHMLLAIDLSCPINAGAMTTVLRFAHLLHGSLDVVCVEDEPDDQEKKAAGQIRDLLRHQPHTFTFIPGYDVSIALENFVAAYKSNLLVMLPRAHSLLRTYLLESTTQEVARLTTIPVLAAV